MLHFVRYKLKLSHPQRTFHTLCDNTKPLLKYASVNFNEILDDILNIERNLFARHRNSDINLNALKKLCSIYHTDLARKKCFKYLENSSRFESHQWKALDVRFKHLKILVFRHLLVLPNKLHPRTPCEEQNTVTLTKFFSEPPTVIENHLQVGRTLQVLRYEDQMTYYLENDAAVLELAIVRLISDRLQNDRGFKSFRNPDTCNGFVLQAVFVDQLSKHGLFLQDSSQVLVGGASLSSFCAVRVGTSTHSKFMPERFFACGRRYVPSVDGNGLFGVCQRTDVNFFISTASFKDMMDEFDSILNWLVKFFEDLGLDFRVCYTRAADLTLAESCRATIQLYSLYEKKFFDVSRVSLYDNFISRRLQILSHDANQNSDFIYIIDGVVISVPTLVACLLERSCNHLFIPKCIQKYMLRHTE